MLNMIETLFDVGQKVFGLKLELSQAKLVRKTAVAGFINAIAQCIEETS
jgi:hypothetical protein